MESTEEWRATSWPLMLAAANDKAEDFAYFLRNGKERKDEGEEKDYSGKEDLEIRKAAMKHAQRRKKVAQSV